MTTAEDDRRSERAKLRSAVRGATLMSGGVLERWLGRPPARWSVDDLVGLVEERGIRLVSLMHVGIDAWLKTLDFVPQSTGHLRDILEGGERADGSSLFRGLGLRGASDILLRPRLETAFLDPFSPLPTLAVLCGHAASDGTPLAHSPDTMARRAAERLETEAGITLLGHGEVEFFLGRSDASGADPGTRDRGYHATAPFVFGEELRRRAIAMLADIGIPVKYGHSEVGYVPPAKPGDPCWEQHEVELGLAPLPAAADAVLITHWVLRNLAQRAGLRCSFDPVVRAGHAGNGLHFHFAPVVGGEHQGGRRPDGTLPDPARWLVAGLVTSGGALMAFGNIRRRTSFRRLRQAKETPEAIVWGQFDRSALVRLPVVATTAGGRPIAPPTIEFRLPDGSAHPHLLLAGVAQALLGGRDIADLDALLHRTRSSNQGGSTADAARVPRNFTEIARELVTHRPVFSAGEVFPDQLLDGILRRLQG